MTRSRKLLALLPLIAAFFLSDKTLDSFGVAVVGGMFLWIPYWLAWWLSDGFVGFFDSYGVARSDDPRRVDDDAFPDRFNEYSGFRAGPHGAGHYMGSTRLDN